MTNYICSISGTIVTPFVSDNDTHNLDRIKEDPNEEKEDTIYSVENSDKNNSSPDKKFQGNLLEFSKHFELDFDTTEMESDPKLNRAKSLEIQNSQTYIECNKLDIEIDITDQAKIPQINFSKSCSKECSKGNVGNEDGNADNLKVPNIVFSKATENYDSAIHDYEFKNNKGKWDIVITSTSPPDQKEFSNKSHGEIINQPHIEIHSKSHGDVEFEKRKRAKRFTEQMQKVEKKINSDIFHIKDALENAKHSNISHDDTKHFKEEFGRIPDSKSLENSSLACGRNTNLSDSQSLKGMTYMKNMDGKVVNKVNMKENKICSETSGHLTNYEDCFNSFGGKRLMKSQTFTDGVRIESMLNKRPTDIDDEDPNIRIQKQQHDQQGQPRHLKLSLSQVPGQFKNEIEFKTLETSKNQRDLSPTYKKMHASIINMDPNVTKEKSPDIPEHVKNLAEPNLKKNFSNTTHNLALQKRISYNSVDCKTGNIDHEQFETFLDIGGSDEQNKFMGIDEQLSPIDSNNRVIEVDCDSESSDFKEGDLPENIPENDLNIIPKQFQPGDSISIEQKKDQSSLFYQKEEEDHNDIIKQNDEELDISVIQKLNKKYGFNLKVEQSEYFSSFNKDNSRCTFNKSKKNSFIKDHVSLKDGTNNLNCKNSGDRGGTGDKSKESFDLISSPKNKRYTYDSQPMGNQKNFNTKDRSKKNQQDIRSLNEGSFETGKKGKKDLNSTLTVANNKNKQNFEFLSNISEGDSICKKLKNAYSNPKSFQYNYEDYNTKFSSRKTLLTSQLKPRNSKSQNKQKKSSIINTFDTSKKQGPKANSFYTTDKNGYLKQWDCITQDLYKNWGQIHTGYIYSMAITKNREFQFTTDGTGCIKQWNLYDEVLQHDWGLCHSGPIYSMIITSNMKYIITVGKDQYMKKFSIKDRECTKNFGKCHEDWIQCMSMSMYEEYLFTGSADRHLKQWSMKTESLYHDYGAIDMYAITSIAVIPGDTFIFTGSDDAHLKQWNVSQKKIKKNYKRVHEDCIKAMVATPDGKFLFTGSDDKTLKMWDIEEENLFKDFGVVHQDWIRTMHITSDGEYLFTTSEDKRLKQWAVKRKQGLIKDYGEAHLGCLITCIAAQPK